MDKNKQFRIKYYDHDDSELYSIIQMAPNESRAISKAEERLVKSSSNFRIIEIEDIDSAEYNIAEIRKILSTSIKERNDPSWLRRKRKMMG